MQANTPPIERARAFTVELAGNGKRTRALVVALRANGTSSYRDAVNVAQVLRDTYGIATTILSDDVGAVLEAPDGTTVHPVGGKSALLENIARFTAALPAGAQLLFVLSAHGYSRPCTTGRELNGRTEFVRVCRDTVADYELHAALFRGMPDTARAMCVVDTCHSGTMLDMEYLALHGPGRITMERSRVPVAATPECVTVSSCGDDELAGEDISAYGGWGGKLICVLLDTLATGRTRLRPWDLYTRAYAAFGRQHRQRSHPVLSYSPPPKSHTG